MTADAGQSRGKVDFDRIRWIIQTQRLIELAQDDASVRQVRDACGRIGLKPGARVVDVGCGPLGALAALADVVGPSGVVVGIDYHRELLEAAGQVLRHRAITGVTLVHADLYAIQPGNLCLPGPFDAAFCRLFLVNQSDPAEALRRMAALVRPGGYIVAHELLDDPTYPVFDPPVPAFRRFLTLMFEAMRRHGRRPDAARQFTALARAAGLDEVSQQGLFESGPSRAPGFIREQGLGLFLTYRNALLDLNLATREEVRALTRDLSAGTAVTYRSFFSWILVELIARVPSTSDGPRSERRPRKGGAQ